MPTRTRSPQAQAAGSVQASVGYKVWHPHHRAELRKSLCEHCQGAGDLESPVGSALRSFVFFSRWLFGVSVCWHHQPEITAVGDGWQRSRWSTPATAALPVVTARPRQARRTPAPRQGSPSRCLPSGRRRLCQGRLKLCPGSCCIGASPLVTNVTKQVCQSPPRWQTAVERGWHTRSPNPTTGTTLPVQRCGPMAPKPTDWSGKSGSSYSPVPTVTHWHWQE